MRLPTLRDYWSLDSLVGFALIPGSKHTKNNNRSVTSGHPRTQGILMKLESKYYRWAPLTVLLAALLVTAVVTWQFWRMLEANDWTRFQSYTLPIQ
ncbi:MAG TPA: hypothetical protein VES89_10960, partial [Candidatus Competibacteraceae bacterium]|nr:hypothetical protein [Candidatus Competibacteraceae bacterium]